jgi:Fe-S cluster assembly scaffold protein SufB
MQKWRANVALHLDKTAQKRIEREREREKNDANSVTASAHTETRHKSCSRRIGMAASAKEWMEEACRMRRRKGRERSVVVVTTSQREGARERQQ